MTSLRRGGIFKNEFVANLLPSPPVKKCENLLILGEVMGKSFLSFLTDSVFHITEPNKSITES